MRWLRFVVSAFSVSLGQPLRVLVEQRTPDAILRGLLQQRREVAPSCAVDRSGPRPGRRRTAAPPGGIDVRAALSGVQQVEDEEVRDELVLRSVPRRGTRARSSVRSSRAQCRSWNSGRPAARRAGWRTRSRSIRFVTGVIASSLKRGKRSVKNCSLGAERNGSAAASHSGFPRMLGIWKIVGCSPSGSIAASSISAAVAWVVKVSARLLRSPHCNALANESTIASTRRSAASGSSPRAANRFHPGCPSRERGPTRSSSITLSASSGSVRQLLIRWIASSWGSRKSPPCPAADKVQELRDRELGLPPPAPPGGVCEERVLEAQADPAFPALVLRRVRAAGGQRWPVNVGRLLGAG